MWWRKRHELPPDTDTDIAGAKHERECAERQLDEVRSQRKEVFSITRKLRDTQERNHFAESIREALTGTRENE